MGCSSIKVLKEPLFNTTFLDKNCHSVLSLSMYKFRGASAPCARQHVGAMLSVRGIWQLHPLQGSFFKQPTGTQLCWLPVLTPSLQVPAQDCKLWVILLHDLSSRPATQPPYHRLSAGHSATSILRLRVLVCICWKISE